MPPSHEAVAKMVSTTTTNLMAKLSVCSWIWVSAWSRLTATQTTEATTIGGPDSISTRTRARDVRYRICESSISASLVGQHKSMDQPRPAVHHDEQEQLERQRNGERRYHHHAHREQ